MQVVHLIANITVIATFTLINFSHYCILLWFLGDVLLEDLLSSEEQGLDQMSPNHLEPGHVLAIRAESRICLDFFLGALRRIGGHHQ